MLTVTTLAQVSLSWALFIFPPIAVEVALVFDIDPVNVGYQASSIFLFTIFATLFSGSVIEKLGPVRSLQLALFVALVGVLLCTLNTIPAILLGSCCFGYSHSLVNPSTTLLLREVTNLSNRGFVFSVKQCSVPIGLLFPSFIGPLIASYHDWRWSMLPLAIMLIAMAIVLQWLGKSTKFTKVKKRRSVFKAPLHALASIWHNKPLMLIAFAGLSFAMCQSAVVTFTSNLFADEKGYSLQLAGFILITLNVGGICGRLSWGFIADKIQDHALTLRIIAALVILCLVLIALLPAQLPLWSWYILFFVVGYSVLGWNGILISEFSHHSQGQEAQQQMAGAFFVLFTGGALSPLLFPLVFSVMDSYATTIGLIGLLFGLAAMLLVQQSSKKYKKIKELPLENIL